MARALPIDTTYFEGIGLSPVGSIPDVRYDRNLLSVAVAKHWKNRDAGIVGRTDLRFFAEKSRRRTLQVHGLRFGTMRGRNGDISRWALLSALASSAAIALSAGYFASIRGLQLAFRAVISDRLPCRDGETRAASGVPAC